MTVPPKDKSFVLPGSSSLGLCFPQYVFSGLIIFFPT